MRRSVSNRSGMTLVEMLLVVGVIAAFASMTVPSVMRMFNQQKLTASAERVREAIASARVRAIETGVIYQFCSEPNGAHFVVVPFEPDHAGSPSGGQGGGTPILSRAWGHLPKGVTFTSATPMMAGAVAPAQTAHKLSSVALDGMPNGSDLGNLNWSSPVLFSADGAASTDYQIIVSDTRGQHVKLHIRAFTGAVTMDRLSQEKR